MLGASRISIIARAHQRLDGGSDQVMESEVQTEQALKDLIVEMVEGAFNTDGQSLLLSRLGQGLRIKGIDVQALIGKRKLSGFISSELSERITLRPSPSDPKILSAFPVGKVSESSDKPSEVKTEANLPRIATAIWAAFTKPLAPEHVRLVDISPPSFIDVPSIQSRQESREVRHSDITTREEGTPKSEYEQAVFHHISQWLDKNALPIHLVTAEAASSRNLRVGKSILEQLFESLSEEQKKRVSFPLDVIERLLDS